MAPKDCVDDVIEGESVDEESEQEDTWEWYSILEPNTVVCPLDNLISSVLFITLLNVTLRLFLIN